ncbi:MAG: hypothetical protein ABH863_03795 [Candidatus Micrarchaeota archaeon]
MLKPIAVAVIFLISLVLAGCLQNAPQPATPATSTETIPTPIIQPPIDPIEIPTAIPAATKEITTPSPFVVSELDANCSAFPDKLDFCTGYKCKFIHPLTGGLLVKEITGIADGKCGYVEQMPNNGKMECKFTESMRKTAAQYYRDVAAAQNTGTQVSGDLDTGKIQTTYTIDGKEVANPLQEALTKGQCIISGYS